MQVERGRFLLFVSSLAAGGAAGYLLSEKDVVPHLANSAHNPKPVAMVQEPEPSVPESAPIASTGQTELTSASASRSPKTCDDSVGEADECPPIGLPMEEGGCGALANTRCNDFKKTMKPRVAAAAVACLKKLKGGAQCDPKRIELCAHNALMNACDDSTAQSVTQSCDAIAATCSGISKQECTRAMSGLRETGREAMLDCAKKHCDDKGILGCEAASPNMKP